MLSQLFATAMANSLIWLVAALALASLLITRRAGSAATFFHGASASGAAPPLLTLVFSQVTTWIFARSLLNAAILGFHYGIWGTLAYTAYYLSFLSGAIIVDQIRFRHGFDSVQDFLRARFGRTGTNCYNLLIGLRLISEVFANILVIGILFGSAGSDTYFVVVTVFAAVTLLYSLVGGLRASLSTDVLQMTVFLLLMGLLGLAVLNADLPLYDAISFKPFVASDPGPVLLLVALLQVTSYPMHDPVMMDRGFLADRRTTRRSFIHACWIALLCIAAFGYLGVLAGAQATEGEAMEAVLRRLLGADTMWCFNAALIVSAMSTLDSTLSSSAKLVAVDMRWIRPTLANGRTVMVAFMVLGLALVFWGSEDLFSAVAVSGTAALYLVPVILFSVLGARTQIPVASYLFSFVLAMTAAALYFTESSGHTSWLGTEVHKYTKLLWLTLIVLGGGCAAFVVGMMANRQSPQAVTDNKASELSPVQP